MREKREFTKEKAYASTVIFSIPENANTEVKHKVASSIFIESFILKVASRSQFLGVGLKPQITLFDNDMKH